MDRGRGRDLLATPASDLRLAIHGIAAKRQTLAVEQQNQRAPGSSCVGSLDGGLCNERPYSNHDRQRPANHTLRALIRRSPLPLDAFETPSQLHPTSRGAAAEPLGDVIPAETQ